MISLMKINGRRQALSKVPTFNHHRGGLLIHEAAFDHVFHCEGVGGGGGEDEDGGCLSEPPHVDGGETETRLGPGQHRDGEESRGEKPGTRS